MSFKSSIRRKLLFGLALVLTMIGILSAGSLLGLYSYRAHTKQMDARLEELSAATRLWASVVDLFQQAVALAEESPPAAESVERVRFKVQRAQAARKHYQKEISHNAEKGMNVTEQAALDQIGGLLAQIETRLPDEDHAAEPGWTRLVRAEAADLEERVADLPEAIEESVDAMLKSAVSAYRTTINITVFSSILVLTLTTGIVWMFYNWVFRPIHVLHRGSRKVASGNFDYRIQVDTEDEMAELAQAFNDMTARFQAVYEDLDRQVRERSRQLIRSERLAGVGFLAAGVAHEINNPLASIAMCSESLESRLGPFLAERNGQGEVVRQYLRMIQDEAFRCKSITERLLDFSRMGDVERHEADLVALVHDVTCMIQHLGKYRGKHIVFDPLGPVPAPVNSQEIKQVILNLVVNGLDSMDPGETLRIEVRRRGDQAEIVFADEGCGMPPEVLENIFEPFFTQRKGGQGTGLGLSISHRIVSQHGGEIEALSPGPSKGSTFIVRLPLTASAPLKEQVGEHANA